MNSFVGYQRSLSGYPELQYQPQKLARVKGGHRTSANCIFTQVQKYVNIANRLINMQCDFR